MQGGREKWPQNDVEVAVHDPAVATLDRVERLADTVPDRAEPEEPQNRACSARQRARRRAGDSESGGGSGGGSGGLARPLVNVASWVSIFHRIALARLYICAIVVRSWDVESGGDPCAGARCTARDRREQRFAYRPFFCWGARKLLSGYVFMRQPSDQVSPTLQRTVKASGCIGACSPVPRYRVFGYHGWPTGLSEQGERVSARQPRGRGCNMPTSRSCRWVPTARALHRGHRPAARVATRGTMVPSSMTPTPPPQGSVIGRWRGRGVDVLLVPLLACRNAYCHPAWPSVVPNPDRLGNDHHKLRWWWGTSVPRRGGLKGGAGVSPQRGLFQRIRRVNEELILERTRAGSAGCVCVPGGGRSNPGVCEARVPRLPDELAIRCPRACKHGRNGGQREGGSSTHKTTAGLFIRDRERHGRGGGA